MKFTSLSSFLVKFLVFRSINEEEVVNNSLEERDENEDRVTSYISKCSEETDDDTSVSEYFTQKIKFLLSFFILWQRP